MDNTLPVLFNIGESPSSSHDKSSSSSRDENGERLQQATYNEDLKYIKEGLANIQINQTLILERISEIDSRRVNRG
jgi:hypothetical protein